MSALALDEPSMLNGRDMSVCAVVGADLPNVDTLCHFICKSSKQNNLQDKQEKDSLSKPTLNFDSTKPRMKVSLKSEGYLGSVYF